MVDWETRYDLMLYHLYRVSRIKQQFPSCVSLSTEAPLFGLSTLLPGGTRGIRRSKMRILLEVVVRESAFAELPEFRLWDSDGRRVLAIVQLPKADGSRSPLAVAVLSLPFLFNQLASAGVKEVGWKGYIPSGRLRPASAWMVYGELRETDLLEARNKALEIARTNGMKLDPDPAEGKVGLLGEIDLAELLKGSSGSGGSGSSGSGSNHSRLK
jgi:hypothetical protein